MKATIVINLDYESIDLNPKDAKAVLEGAINRALGSGDFTTDIGVLAETEVFVEIFK